MINKHTTLDLNGPVLSFLVEPSSTTVDAVGVATFVGIATVTFPTTASNTGFVTYRWYDQNGPLFDDPPAAGGEGVVITGSATSTLTIYNNTYSRSLYLEIDYIPSAYGLPGVAVTVGSARSTAYSL